MIEIQSTITTIIFLLFPMLLYYIYVAHKLNIKEKQKKIILEMLIMGSLLFNILFYYKAEHDVLLLLIPLLLAYLNDSKKLAIIISMILLEFYHNIYQFSFIILIVLFFTLFSIYQIFIVNRQERKYNFVLYFAFTITIFFIIYFLLYNPITIYNYHKIIVNLITFYASITLVIYVSKRTIEIMRFFMTTKEIENEKTIQLSLFKITHEIKNPIAVIKGYIDMFDSKNEDKSEKYIRIIEGEVNRTLNVLNDLSSLSKIKIKKDIMDINILFEDIKQVVIPFCEIKKVNYVFETEIEDFEIKADYGRIKQVIVNLLKNAIEACENGGNIVCTTYSYIDKIFIIIKDNGTGMTPEELKNLFTPFNSSKQYGTGLGVYLSKEIIEAHNGKINYKSIKNKGTIVKIVLPIF